MTKTPSPRPEETSFTKGRIQSFGYAFTGLATLLREQQNSWVHLVATLLVIGLGILFSITPIEWILIIIAIVLVWMAEALNTGVELLCDMVCSDYHPMIKKAKDVSAGAVLVTVTGAVVIGLIIFLPYVF